MAGNYNSGRIRHRDLLENRNKLDVMELKREGAFQTSSAGLQVSPHCPHIAVRYAHGFLTLFRPASDTVDGYKYPLEQLIQIDFKLCRFGGTRPWFRCPNCNNRVSALYANTSQLYYCRICENLAYGSQFESWSGRRYLKANKLRWKLGGKPGAMSPLNRPAKMRKRVFCALKNKIIQLEAAALVNAVQACLWRRK